MKPKHLYIIAISWLVLTVVFCFSLTKGEQSIRQEINRAFREAIDRHYAERVEIFQRFHTPDLNPYAEYYITAPICGRKIKSYELRTWNSITLFVFKDSTDETKARRLLNEHILAQANPIDADKLNTLLQARLASEGITGKTGIIYYHDKETQYSRDTSAMHSAYRTPSVPLDITGNIKAQAWADYDSLTSVRHIDNTFYYTLIFLTLIYIGMGMYRKRMHKATVCDQGIFIDKNKRELRIDGIPRTIARLDLELFCLLWEKKGRCVSREEIKRCFWQTDLNADEKIDTHIKNLRKALKPFPSYRIVTVRGKGYYLNEE